MGMLLRRRKATEVKPEKTTKLADVTPVVEKKATKKADEKKSDK